MQNLELLGPAVWEEIADKQTHIHTTVNFICLDIHPIRSNYLLCNPRTFDKIRWLEMRKNRLLSDSVLMLGPILKGNYLIRVSKKNTCMILHINNW